MCEVHIVFWLSDRSLVWCLALLSTTIPRVRSRCVVQLVSSGLESNEQECCNSGLAPCGQRACASSDTHGRSANGIIIGTTRPSLSVSAAMPPSWLFMLAARSILVVLVQFRRPGRVRFSFVPILLAVSVALPVPSRVNNLCRLQTSGSALSHMFGRCFACLRSPDRGVRPLVELPWV